MTINAHKKGKVEKVEKDKTPNLNDPKDLVVTLEGSKSVSPTINGGAKVIEVSLVQQEFDQRIESDKIGKLQRLLTRANAYSKFLADRLKEQILAPNVEETVRKTGKDELNNSKKDDEPVEPKIFKQPSLVTGGTLRSYQLEGVQWLVSLFENGLNGILADEMGLGKTVQCIAFLAFLRKQGIWGPFLVVAPLSTLSNWVTEFERFTPSIPTLIYHGSAIERESLRRKYLENSQSKKYSVIVTSYEIAMRDSKYLAPIRWKYLIIDEGHRLKNLNCRLIRELKGYQSDNRLLMSGTPLQNNLTELWSLLNFLLPEIFTDVDDFLSWFNFDLDGAGADLEDSIAEGERTKMVSQLHAILKPLLLRRLKSDVEKDLPKKREYILSAELTPLQREYYQKIMTGKVREIVTGGSKTKGPSPPPIGFTKRKRRIINYADFDGSIDSEQEENEELLTSSTENEESDKDGQTKSDVLSSLNNWTARQGLQNRIMQLRKVCNHPYLFQYPTEPDEPTSLLIDEGLVDNSGKMRLLDQLLKELRYRGHKVLLFSQMSRMLDILGDYLDLRGEAYCRIDGSVPQAERQEQMNLFNQNPEYGVFLLSTRAGGLGLNLVTADTVIFYDSDWNPQMDLQAQDRVHRIGQTKPVLVLRLSTANTVEGRMLERATLKRKLERLVIHKKKFKGRQQLLADDEALLTEELLEILKSEEEHVLESRRLKTELTMEEIEAILDRSEKAFSQNDWSTKAVRIVSNLSNENPKEEL